MNASSLFRVVLVEPEIPSNTGNIGRTCVGTNCALDLIGPLGFEIDDKRVKRAGLDYWPQLQYQYFSSFTDWEASTISSDRNFFFTTKSKNSIYDHQFRLGDRFIFGKETKGLPETLLQRYPTQSLTIPMLGPIRSLNLATSVAIVLFEALRQTSALNSSSTNRQPNK